MIRFPLTSQWLRNPFKSTALLGIFLRQNPKAVPVGSRDILMRTRSSALIRRGACSCASLSSISTTLISACPPRLKNHYSPSCATISSSPALTAAAARASVAPALSCSTASRRARAHLHAQPRRLGEALHNITAPLKGFAGQSVLTFSLVIMV